MLTSTEYRTYKCPHCFEDVTIHRGEGDDVDCSCPNCANPFTVGEARRGQLDPDPMIADTAHAIAELRTTVEAQAALIATLMDRYVEIDRAVDRLQQSPEFTTASAATVRVRVNHSHSLKEGWRLSETTVEWTGDGRVDEDAMRDAGRLAYHLGTREAALRNMPAQAEDGEHA